MQQFKSCHVAIHQWASTLFLHFTFLSNVANILPCSLSLTLLIIPAPPCMLLPVRQGPMELWLPSLLAPWIPARTPCMYMYIHFLSLELAYLIIVSYQFWPVTYIYKIHNNQMHLVFKPCRLVTARCPDIKNNSALARWGKMNGCFELITYKNLTDSYLSTVSTIISPQVVIQPLHTKCISQFHCTDLAGQASSDCDPWHISSALPKIVR